MKTLRNWILTTAAAAILGTGGYFFISNTQLNAQETNTSNISEIAIPSTIAIQSADTILGEVSAAGNIALVSQQVVALEVSGVVESILANVGDEVQAGELLMTLDTTELERAVTRTELTVDARRNTLEQLTEPADAADIALAEAELVEAQENLADVLAGPSADEIAAAQSNLASGWSRYNELQAGPSGDELTQLSADLRKAEVAVAEAQRAYDEIAWRNDVGMTQEAANLQDATIDYERALAAYEVSVAPADASDLQSALSSAQNAQVQLDDLLNSPTEADIATAEAQVADAEAKLADLIAGPTDSDLRDAEINLEQALVDLEEARANLAAAQVIAPNAGTILSIDVELGERVSTGLAVMTLADTTQLELTIDVAELDIPQIDVGQITAIEIDALSGQEFTGEVEYVAPASSNSSGVVYYPVTIRLTDNALERVRPGMTAIATVENTQSAGSDAWLVPTTAIQDEDGQATVLVARGEGYESIPVITGTEQGEWTVVQSEVLQRGDQVVGTVASFLESDSELQGPGGPGGGGPFGGR